MAQQVVVLAVQVEEVDVDMLALLEEAEQLVRGNLEAVV
jgi:hypothetical protein